MTVEYELQEHGEGGKMRATDVTAENCAEVQMDEVRAEPNLSKFTNKGTVKFFSRKGYGFITTDSDIKWPEKLPAGEDVYVAREDIVVEEGSSSGLTKGMRVQFKTYVLEDQEGIRAGDVRAEDGSPVAYTPREFDPERKTRRVKVRKFKVKKSAMKSASNGKSKGGNQKRGGSRGDDGWEAAYQKGLAKG